MKHNIFENNSNRQPGMTRLRGGFSEANGISRCNTKMQIDEFDDASRIQISNELFSCLHQAIDNAQIFYYPGRIPYPDTLANRFCVELINDVFCERNVLERGFQYDWHKVFESIHNVIEKAPYNEVLDVVQYVVNWFECRIEKNKGYFYQRLNILFEKEYIGYRFVDGRIVAITDKNETDAVEEACSIPFEGCRRHFEKAIGFLADRENKDYKNCIKESISAVESICQIILKNESVVLDIALRQLEKNGITIHPALKQAYIKLYAFSSDQGGIRHADGMFESNVTFEEAKYMLVSCSAFVNYLIAVSGKGSN